MVKLLSPAKVSSVLGEPLFLTQTWTEYWPLCEGVQAQELEVE